MEPEFIQDLGKGWRLYITARRIALAGPPGFACWENDELDSVRRTLLELFAKDQIVACQHEFKSIGINNAASPLDAPQMVYMAQKCIHCGSPAGAGDKP